MSNDFKLPDLGEGVHEGQIVRLLVNEGDSIREDQPLMEVETDKAAVEIPSPFTGTVLKWHVAEDQLVHVGDVMVTIGAAGTAVETASASATVESKARSAAPAPAPIATPRVGRRAPASPAVRKLARTRGVSLETIQGSGPNGRVTRDDVERAAAGDVPAAPASAPAPIATRGPAPTPSRPTGRADKDNWGEVIRAPLSRPRRTIADTMTESWTRIPHVTDTDDVDVTLLDELRRTYNASNPALGKLSLLPFAIAAVADALRRHPVFNASYDAEAAEIVYKQYVSINVGVQTERGLIAPVLRDADTLSVAGIHRTLILLVQKARSASFEVNDLRGGTFTISNAGAMGGSRYSTPIINPPQVAVLALGRTARRPWVVGDEVVPRLIMPLCISFDHRIIDGAQEIAFQQDIKASLENPGRLLI